MHKTLLLLVSCLISTLCYGQYPEEDPAEPVLKIGGAVRFNYNLSTWKEDQLERGGDFGYDLFRLNVEAKYKGILLNAEYRHYAAGFGGGFLKQGWFGYEFSDKSAIQVGLHQVPFGIQQYNSNNFFFNLTYYIGFEDDHDMGIKYIHEGDRWQWQAAYYKNAEEFVFGMAEASPNRYSYDITGRNKENNQIDLKVVRLLGDSLHHEIGASLQGGLVYNLDTEQNGTRYAGAVHYEHELPDSRWNVKLQAMFYRINPKYPVEGDLGLVQMGAYGANYNVATDGEIYTAGVAYLVPIESRLLESVLIYDNYGYFNKRVSGFEDSQMNVLGALWTAGPMFIYTDAAFGYNHPWLGPEWENALAFGTPGETDWHLRFNINMGYYF
ncbi:hypothetical protein CLV24_10416 [Pontibacter ummariensis]|uniref:Phosphate-selective porin O and P n=1 Tax=Pontibacter ummariensis TaxID=1610492 RepID=A0A239D329_9BACT|nr:hypothetical protein [Pontibacter ummariensis]PRY14206.1 hypothetical protein CLV24_10416 [Pontibacter ummariensis]SNS26438.1 hypothetical protein SAMN06296052_10416 [Pontibacter ummariensis]